MHVAQSGGWTAPPPPKYAHSHVPGGGVGDKHKVRGGGANERRQGFHGRYDEGEQLPVNEQQGLWQHNGEGGGVVTNTHQEVGTVVMVVVMAVTVAASVCV
jgi:hypothetical protein